MSPMGERVGAMLTKSRSVPLIIGIGFLLGFLITCLLYTSCRKLRRQHRTSGAHRCCCVRRHSCERHGLSLIHI